MIYIHCLSCFPQEINKICNHSYQRLRLRDGKAEIQTLADKFRICLSSPMSYIDCSSAKKFGSFHSGDNSARIGLHTFHFEKYCLSEPLLISKMMSISCKSSQKVEKGSFIITMRYINQTFIKISIA